MAKAPKLKVFRMPIGFHDAYVAAPSQKAAAEAWGTDKSVFTRKEAEIVTDPELMKEPLARPGEVIKRLRGTEAEQIAALGNTGSDAAPNPGRAAKPKRPKPRPSRDALEAAEQAVAKAEAQHRAAMKDIEAREAALARERAVLEKQQRDERAKLEARLEKAEAAYREAMQRWRAAE